METLFGWEGREKEETQEHQQKRGSGGGKREGEEEEEEKRGEDNGEGEANVRKDVEEWKLCREGEGVRITEKYDLEEICNEGPHAK